MARTILIADNNAFYRQVLGDFFRAEGYEVALASDGVEALERLMAGGIDILLLDLIMPRVDGARLCRFVKSNERLSSIPVVILSGILADEIEGFETIRADAYVAKMPMDQLQEMLRRVLAGLGDRSGPPVLEGFEKMYRREVVLELLDERRSRDLIQDALTEGIVELSDDQRILRTNGTFEQMVGRSGCDLLSVPIADLFPESREAITAIFDSISPGRGEIAGGVIRHGGSLLRFRVHPLCDRLAASSSLHPVLERAARENPKVQLIQPGKLPGYVLLIDDVTGELRAREERDLLRERAARSERMSAVGLFVAGAAHELNNPLTAVLGYAQLLGVKDLPVEMKESLKRIEEGAIRCKSIVEKLLVFTHRGRSERRARALHDLVNAAIEECQPRASTAGVQIIRGFAEKVLAVDVSGPEIVQAIGAIVDNAVRAAAERPSPRWVRVRTFADQGFACVEVIDSGRGIPPAFKEKIFDPFFTTREVGQGKGLGLSVAYGTVRAHAGQITARNAAEGGAVFTIRLPLPRGAPEERKARVLVVDDEPIVLDLISDALGGTHRVETAVNGREGLVKAGREPYDVILIDMKMPDMTGRQMYEALAALRPEMTDRVVFTTGDTMQEETRSFLDSVTNPCLGKPFSIDALSEMVDRVLAVSRAV